MTEYVFNSTIYVAKCGRSTCILLYIVCNALKYVLYVCYSHYVNQVAIWEIIEANIFAQMLKS